MHKYKPGLKTCIYSVLLNLHKNGNMALRKKNKIIDLQLNFLSITLCM